MPAQNTAIPASLLRRLAASVYDLLLLAGLWMLAGLAVLGPRGGEAVPAGTYWFQALLLALTAAFYIGFWTRGGQTLGMRSWRLRVERRDGRPLGLATASLRLLASLVSLAPAGLGLLWILVDADKLAWHDRLTDSRVVVLSREEARR
ncbi:MAG: RDD family protein [Gammaproteobacteria bacterium]